MTTYDISTGAEFVSWVTDATILGINDTTRLLNNIVVTDTAVVTAARLLNGSTFDGQNFSITYNFATSVTLWYGNFNITAANSDSGNSTIKNVVFKFGIESDTSPTITIQQSSAAICTQDNDSNNIIKIVMDNVAVLPFRLVMTRGSAVFLPRFGLGSISRLNSYIKMKNIQLGDLNVVSSQHRISLSADLSSPIIGDGSSLLKNTSSSEFSNIAIYATIGSTNVATLRMSGLFSNFISGTNTTMSNIYINLINIANNSSISVYTIANEARNHNYKNVYAFCDNSARTVNVMFNCGTTIIDSTYVYFNNFSGFTDSNIDFANSTFGVNSTLNGYGSNSGKTLTSIPNIFSVNNTATNITESDVSISNAPWNRFNVVGGTKWTFPSGDVLPYLIDINSGIWNDSTYGSYAGNAILEMSPDCLVQGTLVKTPNGYIPIESLVQGDIISTTMGTTIVKKIYMSTGYYKTYSLKHSSLSQELEMSPWHAFRIDGKWHHAMHYDKCIANPKKLITFHHISTTNHFDDIIIIGGDEGLECETWGIEVRGQTSWNCIPGECELTKNIQI